MTIRPSIPHDQPERIRMRYALWPDCSPGRHLPEIQQLAEGEGTGVAFVAVRANGSLCGFAEVTIRRDHVDGAASVPVAYLEGWYVDPDLRGRGIGRKLLEEVEKWATSHGLSELASDAELDNESGIVAHMSCGFT